MGELLQIDKGETIAERYIKLRKQTEKENGNVGFLKSGLISWEIYVAVASIRKELNIIEAKKLAKDKANFFYHELLPNNGININIEFSEESKKNSPEVVLAIIDYIKTGKISKELPLLWLSSHQAYGLDALGAYYMFPYTGTILLKDDLMHPLAFGFKGGIEMLDPLVYERKVSHREQLPTIENEQTRILEKGNPLLIFLEATRSRTGNIGKFKDSLYSKPIKIIKEQEKYSKKIAIITAHTAHIFTNTFEQGLSFRSNFKKGTITYTIDIYDIEIDKNIKEIGKDIKNIMENNLNEHFVDLDKNKE